MKQILQNLKNGETMLEEIPAPLCRSGHLSVRTTKSLVSAGTERMLVDFGKGNLLQKARSQPDKVKQVIDKVKTDGLLPTLTAVKNKLESPLPLGYCNVGVVEELGQDISNFKIGDRVASNGKHAELVVVPKNLCAKIPENVDDESASFTVIGAIALQGIRLLSPNLGEIVVVTGLGLIGLVAVQLLVANGCCVIGIDFDKDKLALAKSFGAEVIDLAEGDDPITIAASITEGKGVDSVLITASTKSNEPIHQAAEMCRKRGRIVLVGVVGMEFSRVDFYEKELSFQVSCSYGPGRYDANYEEKGNDYPYAYVRWTEQRNFEAILELLSAGKLNFKPLVSHRYDIANATDAYQLISEGKPLGVLLEYPNDPNSNIFERTRSVIKIPDKGGVSVAGSKAALGFIGAGNYATSVLIPAFAKTTADLLSVASANGVSSVHVCKKLGIAEATTDSDALLSNPQINTIVVSTRHNSHANWVVKGLENDKHIFVEKPLALTRNELVKIEKSYTSLGDKAPILMVGFNRRYSPLVRTVKKLLQQSSGPASFIMTVNAGKVASDHWTQDPEQGGGRIIGEACHFVDLLRFLAGARIQTTQVVALDSENKDSVIINLKFEDGSIGTISYLAAGSKSFPKERLEVFANGGVLQLDNFKSLKGFRWPGFSKEKLMRQDKGQTQCCSEFVKAIESGDRSNLIPYSELIEVANVCFTIVEQI